MLNRDVIPLVFRGSLVAQTPSNGTGRLLLRRFTEGRPRRGRGRRPDRTGRADGSSELLWRARPDGVIRERDAGADATDQARRADREARAPGPVGRRAHPGDP